MATIRNNGPPQLADQAVRRVLYVGPQADEICHFVTQHVGEIDIIYESKAAAAIQRLRSRVFDSVILDLRDGGQSLQLLVPLVRDAGPQIKLIVVSSFKDVSHYLAVPGVARVLSAPVREGQFRRVLGLAAKRRHYRTPEPHKAELAEPPKSAPKTRAEETPPAKQKNLVQRLLDRLMVMISTIYKRSATVLLLTLFSAFLFYGFLIAFFLLSFGWGAPMVLTRGHEMVNKVDRELTELKISLSQTTQKLTEAKSDQARAKRELAEARMLVNYATGTISKEIERLTREQRAKMARQSRLEKIRSQLARQLKRGGLAESTKKLYDKRLITSKQYSSATLGLVEASQRLAQIETELESIALDGENYRSTVEALQGVLASLKDEGDMMAISGGSAEMLAMTQQGFQAKASENDAVERIAASTEVIGELTEARAVLKRQLEALSRTALARAIDQRIDVVFVPYSNRNQFQPGTRLYSCALTIFWCSEAGSVGAPLPGEVSSVHPFFGKPIRGYFVEAKIRLDKAATREIIHGGRAPFYF